MKEHKKKGFEFLEHTADIYIAAYGKNLAEAFENAALAMFESMTDTKDLELKIEENIEAKGFDKQSLLYDWLEKLLIRFEVENHLYSKFNIETIRTTDGGLELKALVYGELFDSRKHKQKVAIKAITYHRMEIQEKPESVTVKFIVDI